MFSSNLHCVFSLGGGFIAGLALDGCYGACQLSSASRSDIHAVLRHQLLTKPLPAHVLLLSCPCSQAGPSSRALQLPTSAQPQPLLPATDSTASSSSSEANSSSSLFRLHPTGLDAVTFLLSAGPAEPLRPLAATASGGEAARVMLALKAAPAAAAAAAAAMQQQQQQAQSTEPHSLPPDSAGSSSSGDGLVSVGPPVLVMDELDAGLGSRLGEPVGRLLAGLVGAGDGNKHRAACQVLMVTHTPQVGAAGSGSDGVG
jgi:hypothetical protein